MNRILATLLICLLFSADRCLAQYFFDKPPDTSQLIDRPGQLAAPQGEVTIEPFTSWESTEAGVYSTGMIWEDCNNDGYIDLFIANGNDMALAANCIYLSSGGTIPTTASWYSSNADYTGHCAVGDIDDNGYVDFLVANFLGVDGFSRPNHSELYRNFTGIPETSASWRTADSMWSFSCALGDPDGDGDLDAAFATGTGYTNTYTADKIYFNHEGTLATLPGWQSTPLTAAMDVTWGDVDNDGDLDLAFCYDYSGAAVYFNDAGIIENAPSWHSEDYQSANTLVFGDINSDGWLDLIVAFNDQLGGGGYYRVYFNDGAGSLNVTSGWESATGGYGSALALYDYDNDGDMDLAAGRWFDQARIYENIGGTFSPEPVWRADPSTVVEEMAWVDVDGSGNDPYADTFYTDGSRKLFYTSRQPLQRLDSILVDGQIITNPDFCHDLISGWVSLAQAPTDSIVIYYQYSNAADLAISNWDTYNMVFSNTYRRLDMQADIDFGWAPLTVQFTNISEDASEWLWTFGDGDSSQEQNPLHVYDSGGIFDVSLHALLSDGWTDRTITNMICALVDTALGDHVSGQPGATVELTIRGRNTFPLHEIRLPVEFNGDLPLKYVSYSTGGCRTEYFELQDYYDYDPDWGQRVTVRLRTATDESQPDLPPGEGDLVKLYFTIDAGASPGQTTVIEMDGYLRGTTPILPGFCSSVLDVNPQISSGSVTTSCCVGVRGNVDGDGFDEVTLDDILYMIDWTFTSGPQPGCLKEADTDGNDIIDIEDLVYLINYVFGTGPPPVDCF